MNAKVIRDTIMSRNHQMFVEPQFLNKLTKFIVSVSVFSLFLSPYVGISRFTLQLLTHTIDKNYMFLFCNGLLVIVAKYSNFITSSPSSSSSSSSSSKSNDQNHSSNNKTMDYEYFEDYRDISEFESISKQYQQEPPFLAEEVMKPVHVPSQDLSMVEGPAKDIYMVQEYHQEMQRGEEEEDNDDEEPGKRAQGHEKEKAEETYDGEEDEDMLFPQEQEDDCGEEFGQVNEAEDEEEEEIGAMATEELNKKFDEFIRKRKEELRIEARRQLIVV